MNKILKYALLIGIFLIPFIPFVISDTMFFPFITGKNFAFRILVELLLGGWAILAVFDKAYRPKFSWLLISILSFVSIIAIADIFGANPFKSIWSNFERMEGLLTLVHLLGYFVVAGLMLNTEKLWNWFWNTTVAVSAIIGIYGLLQLAGKITINQGGVRLDATLGNASYLAIYMLFHVFITAFLLVRCLPAKHTDGYVAGRGASWVRYLYSAVIILQLVILYFTATRGALIGIVGGIFLTTLLIALLEKKRKRLRKLSIGILAIVVVFTGIFFLVKDAEFANKSGTLGRLSSISLEEGATRFTIWGMALQGVKERPLLGWGQENFNFVFNKYYEPSLYAQEQWFDRVHNIFFDWLIAGGILGFLAYISIPIFMLYYLWRRLEIDLSVTEKSIFTGLLAGYFFHNMFVFDNIISYILFFSVAAYIYTHSTVIRKKGIAMGDEELGSRSGDGMKRVAVSFIIVAVIFSLYFFNIKGMATAKDIIRSISPQTGGVDVNIASFEKAASYDVVGKQEIAEQMVTTALNVRGQNADIEIQTKFFELANKEMSALIEEVPNDARLRIFYGAFLTQFNLYDEALPHLKKAVELSPNKQTIRFELGTAYLNLGELDKALEIFKDAYELDTNFKNAEIIYRVGAIYANKEAQVDAVLGPISDEDRTEGRIINAYTRAGRVGDVVKSWELSVEKNPENPQFHISLAAAYLQVGRRSEAVDEIQKAIDLDPNFKEQGEFFIKEIKAGRNP
jgi:tetratricopeptide (TPR) repeat protein/O-antigen ligase